MRKTSGDSDKGEDVCEDAREWALCTGEASSLQNGNEKRMKTKTPSKEKVFM